MGSPPNALTPAFLTERGQLESVSLLHKSQFVLAPRALMETVGPFFEKWSKLLIGIGLCADHTETLSTKTATIAYLFVDSGSF